MRISDTLTADIRMSGLRIFIILYQAVIEFLFQVLKHPDSLVGILKVFFIFQIITITKRIIFTVPNKLYQSTIVVSNYFLNL